MSTPTTTPAPFVRRTFMRTEQRIRPVLETPAILEMQRTMEHMFSGPWHPDVKPWVITCFDTSGSGKTATVGEAARLAGASRIVLSAVFSLALTGALDSCSHHPFRKSPGGLVQRREVEDIFQDKFHATLSSMFAWMAELLSRTPEHERVDAALANVSRMRSQSPPPSLKNVTKAAKECEDAFEALQQSLGKKRKLVLHVDDCQYFLRGVLPSPAHSQAEIPVADVMILALGAFASCIRPFARSSEIVWVFSGSRPTLRDNLCLTSGLQVADISTLMTDFGAAEVSTLLRHFFRLEDATPAEATQLATLCAQLAGPPKIMQFFLQSASWFHSLTSPAALIQQWEAIAAGATCHFRNLVESTYRVGDLYLAARNLVLLHTAAILSSPGGTEEVVFPSISRHLIHLVAAGLLRVHRVPGGTGWKVFPPNRLLIRVLRQHVPWYTWENLELLRSAIRAASIFHPRKGKLFELLFALELCDWARGKLWTFLQEQVGLYPMYARCKPSIHLVAGTDTCCDPSHVHVISDPDLSGRKWDVQLVAWDKHTNKRVRVLAQLTLAECGVPKMAASFDGMLEQRALMMDGEAEELLDHRLFIAPMCKVALEGEGVYLQRYASNRCRAFPKSAKLSEALDLPLGLLCNPHALTAAIERLMDIAEGMGDPCQATTLLAKDHAPSMSMNLVKRETTDELRQQDVMRARELVLAMDPPLDFRVKLPLLRHLAEKPTDAGIFVFITEEERLLFVEHVMGELALQKQQSKQKSQYLLTGENAKDQRLELWDRPTMQQQQPQGTMLPDQAPLVEVLKGIGKQLGWSAEEVAEEKQALQAHRLRVAVDLTSLSPQAWKTLPLHCIIKDMLRQKLGMEPLV